MSGGYNGRNVASITTKMNMQVRIAKHIIMIISLEIF